MERVIVRLSPPEDLAEMQEWLRSTRDGDLFDMDILNHESTFILGALGSESGRMAYLPVQQPLMLENLIFKPGLSVAQTAQAITRLAEYAAAEAYRRDAGELYFLCRDKSTCDFAEKKGFRLLPEELKVYRLNLRETFGS